MANEADAVLAMKALNGTIGRATHDNCAHSVPSTSAPLAIHSSIRGHRLPRSPRDEGEGVVATVAEA
jgi:hypothetical protein